MKTTRTEAPDGWEVGRKLDWLAGYTACLEDRLRAMGEDGEIPAILRKGESITVAEELARR